MEIERDAFIYIAMKMAAILVETEAVMQLFTNSLNLALVDWVTNAIG